MTKFFQLFLLIGLPRIPFTNIPFAIFLILFHYKTIYLVHKENKNKMLIFYFIQLYFLSAGIFIAAGLNDLIFFITLIIKINIGFYSGIIAAKLIFKKPNIVFYWLIIQSIIAILSISSKPIFDFFIVFVPQTSIDTISSIFLLRGIGFGIYHAEGAVIFALVALLPFALNLKKPKYFFTYLTSTITIVSLGSSMLLARSAMIPIFIGFLLRNPKGMIKVILVLVSLTFISPYITPESGVLYESTEIFRNFYIDKKISTKSTDANLNMIVFPSSIEGFLAGEGRFFNTEKGFRSGFYKRTDIGWFRLLLFGGVLIVFPFLILNLMWLVKKPHPTIKQKNFNLILLATFLIMNLKGLFVFTFIISLYYFYNFFLRSQKTQTNVIAKIEENNKTTSKI